MKAINTRRSLLFLALVTTAADGQTPLRTERIENSAAVRGLIAAARQTKEIAGDFNTCVSKHLSYILEQVPVRVSQAKAAATANVETKSEAKTISDSIDRVNRPYVENKTENAEGLCAMKLAYWYKGYRDFPPSALDLELGLAMIRQTGALGGRQTAKQFESELEIDIDDFFRCQGRINHGGLSPIPLSQALRCATKNSAETVKKLSTAADLTDNSWNRAKSLLKSDIPEYLGLGVFIAYNASRMNRDSWTILCEQSYGVTKANCATAFRVDQSDTKLLADIQIPEVDLQTRESSKFLNFESKFSGKGVGACASVAKGAEEIPGNPPARYPEILLSAGVEGEVRAQFLVDTLGLVDMKSFKVIRSDHALFSSAVREALSAMRFLPAEECGIKKEQLVLKKFSFNRAR